MKFVICTARKASTMNTMTVRASVTAAETANNTGLYTPNTFIPTNCLSTFNSKTATDTLNTNPRKPIGNPSYETYSTMLHKEGNLPISPYEIYSIHLPPTPSLSVFICNRKSMVPSGRSIHTRFSPRCLIEEASNFPRSDSLTSVTTNSFFFPKGSVSDEFFPIFSNTVKTGIGSFDPIMMKSAYKTADTSLYKLSDMAFGASNSHVFSGRSIRLNSMPRLSNRSATSSPYPSGCQPRYVTRVL